MTATRINDLTVAEIVIYSTATALCPLIPIIGLLTARRKNRFTTVWDRISGTRVVIKQKGSERPPVELGEGTKVSAKKEKWFGPFKVTQALEPGSWLVGMDPVLLRQVWLLRRKSADLSASRRQLARPTRLRWLQKVQDEKSTWDAFEAAKGVCFTSLIQDGKRIPWAKLRYWLHDLASEIWAAAADHTLPAHVSLDHVLITGNGTAILLDEAWPFAKTRLEAYSPDNISGQQQFLNAIAAHVETTSLPLHARPVPQNLRDGKFEKLSSLTGILRVLLDKPAEVGKGIRAGSIFLLPFYIWVMVFVGTYQGAEWLYEVVGHSIGSFLLTTGLLVLAGSALIQLFELPMRTTAGQAVFRLAVVNVAGERASIKQLLLRWAIVWLPLVLPLTFVALFINQLDDSAAQISALLPLLLWISAAVYAVFYPHQGLHDRVAQTWLVRR